MDGEVRLQGSRSKFSVLWRPRGPAMACGHGLHQTFSKETIHSQVKTAVGGFQSELSTISSSKGAGPVTGQKPQDGVLSPEIGFLGPHAGRGGGLGIGRRDFLGAKSRLMRAVASLSTTETNPEGKTKRIFVLEVVSGKSPRALMTSIRELRCRHHPPWLAVMALEARAELSSQDEPVNFQLGGKFGSGLWSRPHFADKETEAGGGLEALRPWTWQKRDQGLWIPHPILFL